MNQVNFFFFCVKRIYILTSISICVKQDKTSIPSCIIQMIYLFLRENTYHILDSTLPHPHRHILPIRPIQKIYIQNLGFYRLCKALFYFCWARNILTKQPRALIIFNLLPIALLCEICKGKKYRVIRIHCSKLQSIHSGIHRWLFKRVYDVFGVHMMCIC